MHLTVIFDTSSSALGVQHSSLEQLYRGSYQVAKAIHALKCSQRGNDAASR